MQVNILDNTLGAVTKLDFDTEKNNNKYPQKSTKFAQEKIVNSWGIFFSHGCVFML